MSRGWKIVLALGVAVGIVYVVVVGAVLIMGLGSAGTGFAPGAGSVGVIRLDGVISAEGGSLFGGAGIDPVWTAEQLRAADSDPSIDAVVLRVNSPGGSPAASWEIYQAVRDMQKPIVVSVADVAASGAYYFSSPADLIVAAPSSEVGSIGVILMAQDLEGLYEKIGVRYTVLTKGKYKDIGSPTREMTAEEKGILDEQMDAIYEQFIRDVADGRSSLEEDQVRELATGLTYPGEEALQLGLVDKLGTYADALDEAAVLAELDTGDYSVRYLEPDYGFGLFDLFFGTQASQMLRELGRSVAAGVRDGLVEPAAESRLRLE